MTQVDVMQEALSQDTLVLTPGTTIDNTNVRVFASSLSEIKIAGYRYIIIDMNKLEFLSSAGVGAIFSHVQRYRDAGGDIILCSVPETIMYVLTELDVAEHLTIAANREAAELLIGKLG